MRRLRRALDNRGMTLVEVVVSILIVAVFSLTLVVAFGSGSALMRKGIQDENQGAAALSQLEADGGASESATLTFQLGGSPVSVAGQMQSSGGEDGGVQLYVFRP